MSLVGLRMTGFKYETREGFDFDTFMEGLVGKSGEIIHDWDNALVVSFAGNIIAKYPKPEASKYVFKISNDYIDTMDWDKVKEDAEKEKMKKEIFKVGDRIFHIQYGWGVISELSINDILVDFQNKISVWASSDGNLLSFTEYTLQGFSQERPIMLPEVGELCLMSTSIEPTNNWDLVQFGRYVKSEITYRFESINGGYYSQMKRIKILD